MVFLSLKSSHFPLSANILLSRTPCNTFAFYFAQIIASPCFLYLMICEPFLRIWFYPCVKKFLSPINLRLSISVRNLCNYSSMRDSSFTIGRVFKPSSFLDTARLNALTFSSYSNERGNTGHISNFISSVTEIVMYQ